MQPCSGLGVAFFFCAERGPNCPLHQSSRQGPCRNSGRFFFLRSRLLCPAAKMCILYLKEARPCLGCLVMVADTSGWGACVKCVCVCVRDMALLMSLDY